MPCFFQQKAFKKSKTFFHNLPFLKQKKTVEPRPTVSKYSPHIMFLQLKVAAFLYLLCFLSYQFFHIIKVVPYLIYVVLAQFALIYVEY